MNKRHYLILISIVYNSCYSQSLADCKISLFDFTSKAFIHHFDSIIFISKNSRLVFTENLVSTDGNSIKINKIPFGRYEIKAFILGYKDFVLKAQSIIKESTIFNFILEVENVDSNSFNFPGGKDSLICFINKNLIRSFYSLSREPGKINFGIEVDTNGIAYAIFQNNGASDTLAIMNEWNRVINLMPRWTPAMIKGRPIKSGFMYAVIPLNSECK